jgi:hypothetical protein
MQEKRKRDHGERLLGVKGIPCDNEIQKLLDRIEPSKFKVVCNKDLETADQERILDHYRVLDGGVLIALEGVYSFTSEAIPCKHGLHRTKEEKTTYYHRV